MADPQQRRTTMTHRWHYGPNTQDQHERWRDQPNTRWFWTVLEVELFQSLDGRGGEQ
jgi:hypothetical protein